MKILLIFWGNGFGMKYFWRSPWLLGCVTLSLTLLTACDPNRSISNTEQASANCPTTDPAASRFNPDGQSYIDQLFDYATKNIQTNADTITFQTPNHDLVYCRATDTWAILPPSFQQTDKQADESNPETMGQSQYQAIAVNNPEGKPQEYKYRVDLQPNPFIDYDNPPEKATFEILSPSSSKPQIIDLYKLEQVRAAGVGYDLGLPTVNAVTQVGNYLFFAISSEQGEGFNGITTLIRYNLTNNKLEPIQPLNLLGEQITKMVATEADGTITLWLGTKYSQEGSSRIPAKGLVTYSFTEATWAKGKVTAYSIHNSPLVGAIPQNFFIEDQTMWVATGGGICRFPLQQVQQWEAWKCWRFALEADISAAGLPLYKSLLATTPITTLTPLPDGKKTEVYWWSGLAPTEFEEDKGRQGRFEVAYPQGLRVAIPEGGAYWKNAALIEPAPPWEDHVFWPGHAWHWQGTGFERDFDEVDFNYLALGATGISERGYTNAGLQDVNAMRGRLSLLSLTTEKTEVTYFSGWVDDALIEAHFVLLPSQKQPIATPNPLKAITPSLESF